MQRATRGEEPNRRQIWRVEHAYCATDAHWLGGPSRNDIEDLKAAEQYGY